MKAQITQQNSNGSIAQLETAMKGWSNMEGFGDINSHINKGNEKSIEVKATSIERYQRLYNIEYTNDSEIIICSVDGNTDVDETYSEDFIKHITNKIDDLESSASNKDDDEDYDNHFQNYEVL